MNCCNQFRGGVGIHLADRVIQNDNGFFVDQCPCKRNSLFLTAGKLYAPFPDYCIVPIMERTYEIMYTRHFTSFFHRRLVRTGRGKAEIFSYREVEQDILLHDAFSCQCHLLRRLQIHVSEVLCLYQASEFYGLP